MIRKQQHVEEPCESKNEIAEDAVRVLTDFDGKGCSGPILDDHSVDVADGKPATNQASRGGHGDVGLSRRLSTERKHLETDGNMRTT